MKLPRATRVGAYAVCVHGDAILLARRVTRAADVGLWTLPGGGVDFGEDPADAVVRECQEELGLTPVVGTVLAVHSNVYVPPDGDVERHGIRLLFTASFAGDPRPEPRCVDPTEIDAVGWFSLSALPGSLTPWAALGVLLAGTVG